jgi:hypothetical protein
MTRSTNANPSPVPRFVLALLLALLGFGLLAACGGTLTDDGLLDGGAVIEDTEAGDDVADPGDEVAGGDTDPADDLAGGDGDPGRVAGCDGEPGDDLGDGATCALARGSGETGARRLGWGQAISGSP